MFNVTPYNRWSRPVQSSSEAVSGRVLEVFGRRRMSLSARALCLSVSSQRRADVGRDPA
jgi:hypothetical protein